MHRVILGWAFINARHRRHNRRKRRPQRFLIPENDLNLPRSATPPASPATSRWREAGVVLALLILVALPRLVRLTADPPRDMQEDVLFDEGGWAHNARQRVLFGQWVMDENNAPLIAAPLYTVTLAGVYKLLGTGVTETRLLAAVSGVLTCLLFYGIVRRWTDPGRAAAATVALGCSYFMLSHNRVSFTESFQLLFVLGTMGGILLAESRPVWGLAGGLSFGAAMLAKPSAVVILPAAVAYGIIRFWESPSGERRSLLQGAGFFAVGTLAILLVVGMLVVYPHREWIERQGEISFATVYGSSVDVRGRLVFLGWDRLGLSLNGFFRQTAIPLFAVILLAASRLGRTQRERMSRLELLSWLWLGIGLLLLASQLYQPDRRFLILLPPALYLALSALAERGAPLPTEAELRDAGPLRRMVIGGLVAGLAGLYLGPLIDDPVRRILAKLPIPILGRLTEMEARMLVWNLAAVAGAGLLAVWPGVAPRRRLRVPVAPLLIAFFVLEPLRFGWALTHPKYTVIEASRFLDELERRLPPGRHSIGGGMANTLALESRLFAFVQRVLNDRSITNSDALARFAPEFAVVTRPLPLHDPIESLHREEAARGLQPCRRFDLWPDRTGQPRWLAMIYARPGACPSPESR
jgi:4-amino-4-deoxy-L-arabinose transferase-like glycosyltransferase